ncbi:hypothetical protein KAZ57_00390 [Patescibacteria group bacterium]|nr:hypothetical protein [Patescibacteria group bacterium]
MQNPLKKKSTKIIQIVSDNSYGIRGLGDDSKIYEWRRSNSSWYLHGDIDDQVWEELK